MIRARFRANLDDPRPVNWPIKHPYWVSGQAGDGSYSIIVAYADNEEEIIANWPEASHIDSQDVDGYIFTDRFSRPDWLKGGE